MAIEKTRTEMGKATARHNFFFFSEAFFPHPVIFSHHARRVIIALGVDAHTSAAAVYNNIYLMMYDAQIQ